MRALLLATVATLAFAGSASATILSGTVSTGGSFIKLGVPFMESEPDNTVGADNFNDSNL